MPLLAFLSATLLSACGGPPPVPFTPVADTKLLMQSVVDPNADIVWTQDEPENQGAWPFICLELAKHLKGRTIKVASRPASASPATGSSKRSAQEQVDLIEKALKLA